MEAVTTEIAGFGPAVPEFYFTAMRSSFCEPDLQQCINVAPARMKPKLYILFSHGHFGFVSCLTIANLEHQYV